MPSSFAHVSPIRLSLLSKSPCVGSGYERNVPCRSVFMGAGTRRLSPLAETHSSFNHLPIVTVLGWCIELVRDESPQLRIPTRPNRPLRCRVAFRCRNLNRLPFRRLPAKGRLRIDLPAADDASQRKPGSFGGAVSHGTRLLLSPGLSLQVALRDVNAPLLRNLHASLPHHAT